jgi:predicted permease
VLGFVGVLSAIALLIVGVACVNIAGLLLHRGQARRAEFAVRQALGATRAALLRQLAVETLLIFAAGQAAGVALAASATRSLNRFLPESAIPIQLDLAVDWRVALLATGITLLCAVVFGLAPGLTASRVAPWTALRPSAAGAPGRERLRRALGSAQFGASLVLLVVAGLFARTLSASEAGTTGVTATGNAIGAADARVLSLSESAGRAYFDAWLDEVRRSPGVTHAALARSLPVALGVSTSSIEAEGASNPIGGHAASSNVVSTGYFDALGIPVLAGRDFSTSDRPDTEPVAIVSRATAVELFGAQDAVGRYLVEAGARLRIVGVTGDVAVSRPGAMNALIYYLPFAQRYAGRMSLVASGGPDAPLDAIRLGAASANPLVPLIALSTFDARLGERFFAERMAASIAGVFGALGVVLAMVGLYAVVAFQAMARRRELAVRLALGASRRGIRRLVLVDGLRQALTGLGAGLVAAWFLAAAIRGVVPGISPADPAAFAGAVFVLTLAALIASDLPARRAASADPMSTLRSDQ